MNQLMRNGVIRAATNRESNPELNAELHSDLNTGTATVRSANDVANGMVNGMPAAIAARLAPARVAPPARTLLDVREAVMMEAQGHWDTRVPRDQISFKDGQLVFVDRDGEEQRLRPTGWASGQLCARLGIPAGYFQKCPDTLQDVQANYWLRALSKEGRAGVAKSAVAKTSDDESSDDKSSGVRESATKSPTGRRSTVNSPQWFLRAKGQTLRAVLSERYCALDNTDLLESLQPLWQKHYAVDWFALGEESLHLRIVDPKRSQQIFPNDTLSVGIHLSNSEVGARAVAVDALIYRLVCSNGLIRLVKGKSLLRQRHVHIAGPRFVAALEEAVACAWSEAESFLGQVERTTSMPVPEVEKALESIAERWHLSEAVQADVLQSLRREPARIQETVYGLINAFTNAAQRLPDEGRYDLEVLAGHLAEYGVNGYGSSGGSVNRSAGKSSSKESRKNSQKKTQRGVSNSPVFSQSVSPESVRLPELQRNDSPNSKLNDDALSDNKSFDVIEVAQEMFEADIVARRPRLLQESRKGDNNGDNKGVSGA